VAKASRSQIEREIARVAEARPALDVLEREVWPDGTEVVWLASPFPFERKPVVPGRMHKIFRVGQVDLATLVGTQCQVTQRGVEQYSLGDDVTGGSIGDLPLVYHADSGKSYVADGHHRLAAAYLRGARRAWARIVEIGALDR
jgi:hypothetical protein